MTVQKQQHNISPGTAECAPDDIRAQLARIVASRVFAEATRLQEFLRYVVTESLSGRANRIKGFTIAQDVFHKKDPTDAQTSTIVRVEAGRLRRRLIEYYADEGRNDPVRIEIPKGAYVPHFVAASLNPASIDPALVPVNERPATRRWQSGYRAVAGLILILAVVTGGLFLKQAPVRITEAPPSASALRPAIAVLPFEDAALGGTGQMLAAGLTEDIITDLSRVPGVDVIALSSVAMLRSQDMTPRQIANQLGVAYVLRGDVRGAAPEYRVTAQLYDAQTNRQVWADRFDRNLGSMLELQDELATRVVQGMSLGLDRALPESRSPRNSTEHEARVLYRQAMDLVNPPNDVDRLLIARQAFERSIEIDPAYAGAYAGLAYTHIFADFFGHSEEPAKDQQMAIAMAERALELDPSVGLAYTTLAFVELSRRNFAAALDLSKTAVESQPGDPYVNIYHAYILAADGRAAEGVSFAKRAQRLDPLATRTPYLNILAFVSFYAGDYQQALNAHDERRRRGGPFTPSHQAYAAASYAALGQDAKAKVLLTGLENGGSIGQMGGQLASKFRRPEDVEKLAREVRKVRE